MAKRSRKSSSSTSSKSYVATVPTKDGVKLVKVGGPKKAKGCPKPLGGNCANSEKLPVSQACKKVCKPNTILRLNVFGTEANAGSYPRGVPSQVADFPFTVQLRYKEVKKNGMVKIKPEVLLCKEQQDHLSTVASLLFKRLEKAYIYHLMTPAAVAPGEVETDISAQVQVARVLKLIRVIEGKTDVISSPSAIKSVLLKVLHRMVSNEGKYKGLSKHLKMLAYAMFSPMKVAGVNTFGIGWEDSLVLQAILLKKLYNKSLPQICRIFKVKKC